MAAASAGAQNRCVFVGNIPYDATEEQLVQICEEVGPVVSFRLVIDKDTGKPKGYGFCEYKDEETALSARRNLQGYEINGRQLRVDFAENGRNTDRNREKGRGGPGMASSVDTQKQLSGTSIVGDTSLHQPVGLPPAIQAASVMAGVLGGAQTANVQNGLPVQYGLGNDPLTHYLARMSRHQLYEIMSELKSLATQNKGLAKNLLQGIPQLPKALFQAQIMLGMVTPQMMQMAKSQQPSSSLAQSSSHLNEPFPQPDAMMPIVPRASVNLPANIPSNPTILQEPTSTLNNFPQYQHSSQPPVKTFPHGHQSGVVAHPPMLSQPLGTSSSVPTQPLATSGGFISQVQPPFMPQHPRAPVTPASVQQLPLTHPHLPQVAAAPEIQPKEMRLPDQASHLPELAHPSKLLKLEDGTSTPGIVNNSPGRSQNAEKLSLLSEFLWRNGGPRSNVHLIHSIWANFQTSTSNIIFGHKWRHLSGERDLWERFGGVDISLDPCSFGQANTLSFNSLLHRLNKYVPRGSTVVDLYSGAGVIGLSIAASRKCRSVKCVEINKMSKMSFEKSASRLPTNLGCTITWHNTDASVEPVHWLEGSSVVIVDPPRKGLHPSVLSALQKVALSERKAYKAKSSLTKVKDEKRPWILRAREAAVHVDSISTEESSETWPETLIYISCGWESFKKDCKSLISTNAWNLENAHAFNFFPGTDSIEVLAIFKRELESVQKKKKKAKKKKTK